MTAIFTSRETDSFLYLAGNPEKDSAHFYKIYNMDDFVDNKINVSMAFDEVTGFECWQMHNASPTRYRVLLREDHTVLEEGEITTKQVVFKSPLVRKTGSKLLEISNNIGPIKLNYTMYKNPKLF